MPFINLSIDVPNDPEAIDDFLMLWRAMIKQNAALICFREGSDEIVGLNMNFVTLKGDHFMEDCREQVRIKFLNLFLGF